MFKIILVCFLFFFISCAKDLKKQDEPKLIAQYKLVIKEKNIDTRINFFSDNSVSYRLCNTIFGTFSKDKKSLTLNFTASTKMLCAKDLMQVENEMLKEFNAKFEMKKDAKDLILKRGKKVFKLQRL